MVLSLVIVGEGSTVYSVDGLQLDQNFYFLYIFYMLYNNINLNLYLSLKSVVVVWGPNQLWILLMVLGGNESNFEDGYGTAVRPRFNFKKKIRRCMFFFPC